MIVGSGCLRFTKYDSPDTATEENCPRRFLDLSDRIYRMSKELLVGRFIWIVKELLKSKIINKEEME